MSSRKRKFPKKPLQPKVIGRSTAQLLFDMRLYAANQKLQTALKAAITKEGRDKVIQKFVASRTPNKFPVDYFTRIQQCINDYYSVGELEYDV